MEKLGHKNLFDYAAQREVVYERFQDNFDRDTWVQWFWRIVILIMAVGAAMLSNRFDWLWLFGGILAAERAITAFIDNSNRNWAMHIIDWIEHNRLNPTEHKHY